MWIVKLGGGLHTDPLLPQWLDLLARLGGGRIAVVAGGGGFADEARRLQAHWKFDDLARHNMVVLAMAQSAYQLHALNPALQLASRQADIRRVLHSSQTALWLPLESQRDETDVHTGWHHTSDSIALDLARRLNAERLVVVKCCSIDPSLSLRELGRAGVLDRRFAALSERVEFPVNLLNRHDLAAMQALLFDEGRHPV